jgi:hypothetical protein
LHSYNGIGGKNTVAAILLYTYEIHNSTRCFAGIETFNFPNALCTEVNLVITISVSHKFEDWWTHLKDITTGQN